MLPVQYIEECFGWIESNCPTDIWDNAGILAWLRHKGLPIRTTMPLLVQHIGDDSLVDPTLPIRRSERFEMNPVADWSCTDVVPMPELDWFKPVDWSDPKRQLTANEVVNMFVKNQINVMEVDDTIALRMLNFYPTFEKCIGQTVGTGFKFLYHGELYKVRQQGLTIQAHYPPGIGTESLYTRIDETHAGTADDPIPYSGNMLLEENKYYTQDGILYLCNRAGGSGIPLSQPLAELVGHYVKIV